MDEVVDINVGGAHVTTTRTTLCRETSSMLARMFAGDMVPGNVDKEGRYFIDRSGEHFGTVLAYLRREHVVGNKRLLEEFRYYQVRDCSARPITCIVSRAKTAMPAPCQSLLLSALSEAHQPDAACCFGARLSCPQMLLSVQHSANGRAAYLHTHDCQHTMPVAARHGCHWRQT